MTREQAKTCVENRRDREPCRAKPLPGRERCWSHAPELAEKRLAARQSGGLNSSGPARVRKLLPSRLAPLIGCLENALGEVHDGTLAAPQAQAMASLARAIVALFTSGELEERLRTLESGIPEEKKS